VTTEGSCCGCDLGGEPEECDKERESSEMGQRLYCCMKEAHRSWERQINRISDRERRASNDTPKRIAQQ